MTNATLNNEVVKALLAANKAMGTVLNKCREAAKLAFDSLTDEQRKLPVTEQHNLLVDTYADTLGTVDHNVRSNFKDFTLLLVAGDTPVSLEKKVDGVKAELHTTATAAAGMAKHAMKEAVKQVREALGTARAEGGGRKPKTAESAPVQTTADNEELAFTAFLKNIPVYMDNPAYALRIKAVFRDELSIAFRVIK